MYHIDDNFSQKTKKGSNFSKQPSTADLAISASSETFHLNAHQRRRISTKNAGACALRAYAGSWIFLIFSKATSAYYKQ